MDQSCQFHLLLYRKLPASIRWPHVKCDHIHQFLPVARNCNSSNTIYIKVICNFLKICQNFSMTLYKIYFPQKFICKHLLIYTLPSKGPHFTPPENIANYENEVNYILKTTKSTYYCNWKIKNPWTMHVLQINQYIKHSKLLSSVVLCDTKTIRCWIVNFRLYILLMVMCKISRSR
jgi:hypothetical protein